MPPTDWQERLIPGHPAELRPNWRVFCLSQHGSGRRLDPCQEPAARLKVAAKASFAASSTITVVAASRVQNHPARRPTAACIPCCHQRPGHSASSARRDALVEYCAASRKHRQICRSYNRQITGAFTRRRTRCIEMSMGQDNPGKRGSPGLRNCHSRARYQRRLRTT